MYSGGSRFSPGFRAWIAVSVEQVRHEGGEGATPRQRGGRAAAFAPLSLWWRHNTLRRHHSDFSAPGGRSLPIYPSGKGGAARAALRRNPLHDVAHHCTPAPAVHLSRLRRGVPGRTKDRETLRRLQGFRDYLRQRGRCPPCHPKAVWEPSVLGKMFGK